MKAIILAAGMGTRLRDYVSEPKCLLEVGKERLVEKYVRVLNEIGVDEIVFVVGYKAQSIKNVLEGLNSRAPIITIENPDYRKGSILSLWQAKSHLNGDVLLMDADVYFDDQLLYMVRESAKLDYFLLDTGAENDGEAVMVGFRNDRAVALNRGLSAGYEVKGEMVGFIKFSEKGSAELKVLVENYVASGEEQIGYEFMLPDMFERYPIGYELVDGLKWIEIDFKQDAEKAKQMTGDR